MANMGFPVITRLGTHQFWYNHWYTDQIYSRSVLSNRVSMEYNRIFFKFGVDFRAHIFTHRYWCNKIVKATAHNKFINDKKLYFRKKLFENTTFGVRELYDENLTTGEYFPLRMWSFRFRNWYIMCSFWFKPKKKKLKKRIKVGSKYFKPRVYFNNKNLAINLNRFKILTSFLTNNYKF